MNPIGIIAAKERRALVKDQRGVTWLLAYTAVLSCFALLLVSNTELSLLDNAQIVYLMVGTVTAVGAAIAVILGSDSFAGERERGTLVPLLTAPVTPGQLLGGKTVGLVSAWGILYLLALPYLWAVGAGGQNLAQAIVYLGLFGTPVVLGFGLMSMAVSAKTGSVMASLVSCLIVLAFAAAPLVLDPSLRSSTVGRALDMVNPFAGALNTYDAVIVDSETFFAQWPRLVLVAVWLGAASFAALRAARRPTFR
jgi:ABC-type transport system involved in multi-copper enzyme maturation permease subunit